MEKNIYLYFTDLELHYIDISFSNYANRLVNSGNSIDIGYKIRSMQLPFYNKSIVNINGESRYEVSLNIMEFNTLKNAIKKMIDECTYFNDKSNHNEIEKLSKSKCISERTYYNSYLQVDVLDLMKLLVKIKLKEGDSMSYLNKDYTLNEFIETMGGWDKVKKVLTIKTKETAIPCNQYFNKSNPQIQNLLPNKMYSEPVIEDGGIIVFVKTNNEE